MHTPVWVDNNASSKDGDDEYSVPEKEKLNFLNCEDSINTKLLTQEGIQKWALKLSSFCKQTQNLLCFKLHVKCMTPGTLASAISSSGSSTSASSVLVEDKCFKRKHYYGSASKEPIWYLSYIRENPGIEVVSRGIFLI